MSGTAPGDFGLPTRRKGIWPHRIYKAQKELWNQLLKGVRNKYFVLGSGYLAVGSVVTVLTLTAVTGNARDLGTAVSIQGRSTQVGAVSGTPGRFAEKRAIGSA